MDTLFVSELEETIFLSVVTEVILLVTIVILYNVIFNVRCRKYQIATSYGNLIEIYKTVMSNFREW